ncbi:MAG: D-alanyl-D-alanine carboxypeptidase [Treponema sp.]|nr:D-alanyl-D-alanine carboxypeptidase [Treponema sp.]
MRLFTLSAAFVAAFLALSLFPAAADSSSPTLPAGISAAALDLPEMPPVLNAKAAVVMDATTGTIVYAKNPDLAIPPASLTKLVTLDVVYNEIAAGRISKDTIVTINKHDCSPYIPYGSSIMYLRPDMHVSIMDLMRGAAVVSGCDAAFALARAISGSYSAFADLMNQAVDKLGLTQLHFVEPSGLSGRNTITAREYAYFCRDYMELHPEAIGELHSLRYIVFPKPENATPDYTPKGRIVQYNVNSLIFRYPGCDGLKTGFINESGYNLAATAERNGTRFIIVTLGGSGAGAVYGGSVQRSHDGAALLDWAFASYVTLEPKTAPISPVRTWYGDRERLDLQPATPLAVTVPKSDTGALEVRVDLPRSLVAPVEKGARVGEVVYSVNGTVLHRVDLVAAETVERGNIFIVIRDAVERFFGRLFGSPSGTRAA